MSWHNCWEWTSRGFPCVFEPWHVGERDGFGVTIPVPPPAIGRTPKPGGPPIGPGPFLAAITELILAPTFEPKRADQEHTPGERERARAPWLQPPPLPGEGPIWEPPKTPVWPDPPQVNGDMPLPGQPDPHRRPGWATIPQPVFNTAPAWTTVPVSTTNLLRRVQFDDLRIRAQQVPVFPVPVALPNRERFGESPTPYLPAGSPYAEIAEAEIVRAIYRATAQASPPELSALYPKIRSSTTRYQPTPGAVAPAPATGMLKFGVAVGAGILVGAGIAGITALRSGGFGGRHINMSGLGTNTPLSAIP